MNLVPVDGDLKNFVVNIHWSRKAKETINNKEYFETVFGCQLLSKNKVNNFISYQDLTYEIVCKWLDSSLDVEALDANLDAKIKNQINPPIVSLPLPFNNPE